ncbi:reverse transcriptase [Phytophthora megakarya]|uniref:Reverse transcriptase n=1 Tax=Phytophthora megakarya TaxID=4795 RepID=A0A225WM85_9STRA|nr:reverse transcriptase [Phytophthora megakarya]
MVFLGEGNALPPPTRGIVCDVEVGDAKPISMRMPTDSLSNLMGIGHCPVMKNNFTDVRLCFDYPDELPRSLIVELMSNFAASMWLMTLDKARGFWVIPMTARSQLISVFVCPLGPFQWKLMSFGLKAPLIYQQLLDNCLGLCPDTPKRETACGSGGARVSRNPMIRSPEDGGLLDHPDTVFHQNRVAPEPMGPVLSWSWYIDDISYGAPSWDDLCKTRNDLLYQLRYWNIAGG